MNKRLKEILDRKAEIRSKLQSGEQIDLAAFQKELEDLDKEEKELRSRLDIASKINVGSIPSDPVQKPEERKAQAVDPLDTPEYRQAFFDYVKTGVMAEEFRASAITTTADAGAMIPTTTLNKIIDKLTSQGMILPLVTQTAYNCGVSIPTSSVKPVATWVADGSGSDVQKKTVGNVSFNANKLRCAVGVSFNMENMSLSAFEATIVKNIADAMTKAIEQAIINGTGNGQPTGILEATVPTGQTISVSTIDYQTMVNAEAAIPLAYETGGVYVMAKQTFMQYVGMVDSNKQPIARVTQGINGGVERTLLGRKVVCCDYLPNFSAASAGATFAFIFNMEDYVFNTNFSVALRQYEDYVTDDVVRKAIMLADGKVVDNGSLVVLQKAAAA